MILRIQRKQMLRTAKKKRKFEKRKPPQEMKRTQLGGAGISRKEMEKVEADVAIDRSKLDFENARQTELFEKYNKKYMEVLEKKLLAEETFNGKKAVMAGYIRRNADGFGLDKITEGAVQLALPNHPDYKDAHAEYLKAYLAYEYYLGIIENISRRPTLLSNLGRLIEVGYWTRTSMSQEE